MGFLIAVDFDATLTTGEGDPWWEDPFDEEPDEDMIELVNACYERGHYINVWTARPESMRRETTYYLDSWNLKYHALVMEKHSPAIFLDDRAVNELHAKEMGVEGVEQFVYDDEVPSLGDSE